MMRKLFIILFLSLLPSSLLAWGVVPISGGVTSTEAFCSTCTGSSGTPSLCWEVATDTENITTDGGCVISGGDASATAYSAVDITAAPSGKTGYAVTWSTTNDYYALDVSSDDLIDDTVGTITFDVYITDLTEYTYLLRLFGAHTDQIRIEIIDTDELRVHHEGNDVYVRAWTTDNNLSLNTWYSVTVKWRTGETDPSLSIAVAGIAPGAYGAVNNNLTAFTTQAAAGGLRIGNDSGTLNGASIKNIKIYKEWID